MPGDAQSSRRKRKIPKRIVARVASRCQSHAVVHDDLDLDIAQAHIEATIDIYLDDPFAFKRALKAAGAQPPPDKRGVEVANVILAFFDRGAS
jgi:hypothetical protein